MSNRQLIDSTNKPKPWSTFTWLIVICLLVIFSGFGIFGLGAIAHLAWKLWLMGWNTTP